MEYQHPVRVQDRVESVGNGQHCLVGKALADGLLQQLVCLLVYTRCGFINAENLGICEESPGQAQQLPLSQGQAPAPLAHLTVQATNGDDHLTQVALLQDLPQGPVLVLAPGVQVFPNGPTEQEGLLGDDS